MFSATMEAHYPRFLLYGLLLLGSWLISCLLHFQFVHLYLLSSVSYHNTVVILPLSVPIAFNASVLPSVSAAAPSTASCEGRYVYMLDVPSRFDVLSGCIVGSPAFQD